MLPKPPTVSASGYQPQPRSIMCTVSCFEEEPEEEEEAEEEEEEEEAPDNEAAKAPNCFTGTRVRVEICMDGINFRVAAERELGDMGNGMRPSAVGISIGDLEPTSRYFLRAREFIGNQWSEPGPVVVGITSAEPFTFNPLRGDLPDQLHFYNSQRDQHIFSYLDRFKEMVQELRAHPDITVLDFHTFQPITPQALAEQERVLGVRLHESIRAFFMQTNGLQLRWIVNTNEEYDELVADVEARAGRGQRVVDGNFVGDEEELVVNIDGQIALPWSEQQSRCDGCVLIPPLHRILQQDNRERFLFDFMKGEAHEFMGKEVDLYEWTADLRIADLFSDYNSFALLLSTPQDANGRLDPIVLPGNDYNASFMDGYATDFYSYLECVLACKGHVMRRVRFFAGFRGYDKRPPFLLPLSFWQPEFILDLDSLVRCNGEDIVRFVLIDNVQEGEGGEEGGGEGEEEGEEGEEEDGQEQEGHEEREEEGEVFQA